MNQAPSCLCHVISSTKTPILMWKQGEKQWILKIADQKFLGNPRLDKRGEIYWKFKNWEEILFPGSENNSASPVITASLEKGEIKVVKNEISPDSTLLKENQNVKSENSESASVNPDHSETPK